jgi:hypothetical protein
MSRPMFEIESIHASPEKIMPGSNVELKIRVKNIGGEEAESVSIRAFKESSQPFEFDEKSDFIGKLKPGETGEAVLKFSVDKEAVAKEHILDLEIRSIYGEEVLTQDKTATVKIEDSLQNNNLMTGIIIIVVIVAAGVIIYKFVKGKKK